MSNKINVIDVSAWIGTYPFRGIPDNSLQGLKTLCQDLSIKKVIASSFENLFWENGLDAYKLWEGKLKDFDCVEYWPVVNPTMPGQIEELRQLVEHYRPRGVRILPNYHGYNLYDNCVKEFMCFCKEYCLTVQVFQRIADERWNWMLRIPPVDQKQLEEFVDEYTNQAIIACAMNRPELLSDRLRTHSQLYADTSRVRGPLFAFEELVQAIPVEKILFGSLWPIQITQATLWQIQHSNIPAKMKSQILNENFQQLFN